MRNVMIAAFAVFLVTLIILANFSACVAVLLMVTLTDIMLFGPSLRHSTKTDCRHL